VALQVPGSEYLLDLMDHSMDNQTVCHFGERASWRVLPSLYVKGIVGRCRKKNRHIVTATKPSDSPGAGYRAI
jgi:hypothetical protein